MKQRQFVRFIYNVDRRSSARHRDAIAVGFLLLLSLFVFAPELFFDLRLVDDDILKQSIPVLSWYGRAVQNGNSFLWSSGILGGFPIAFTQYSLLFPVDWIVAHLFDANRAFVITLAAFLPLAGIASYFYVQEIGVSRWPALLAAVGYQLCTETLALGVNGYAVRSLFLLPTLLLATELILRRNVKWAILGVAALATSLVGGTAYITSIALLDAGIYVVIRAFLLWRRGLRESATMLVGVMGLSVLLGTGLAAIRVLPTIPVTAESVRSQGMSFLAASTGSPTLGALLAGYLLPLTRMSEFSGSDIFAPPGYVGPVILILAVIATIRSGEYPHPWTRIFLGLLIFDLLVSMGENGPLFQILYQIPPFTYFRAPSRFSTASAFFLTVLAAQVLDKGIPTDVGRRSAISGLKAAAIFFTLLFASAVAIGFFWLYGGEFGAPIRAFAEAHNLGAVNPLRPRVALALGALPVTLWLIHGSARGVLSRNHFQILSVGVTTCLLLVIGLSLIPRERTPVEVPATARFLQTDRSLFRVMSFRPGITLNLYLRYLAEDDPKKVDEYSPASLGFRYRYLAETLSPNFALQYGLESIDGYEVLQSVRQAVALSYIGSDYSEIHDLDQVETGEPGQKTALDLFAIRSRNLMDHLPALRAFNVKYVLTNLELWDHPEELRLVYSSLIPMLDPRTMTGIHVYEVVGALPRAFLVPESRVASGGVEALDAILSRQVDPTGTVILEQPVALPSDIPRLDRNRSAVKVASYTNAEAVLNVQADGSGYLVINDAFYPGWSAWVDGVAAPIYPANGWVRAIPIETSGNHEIRLTYEPPLFKEGVWVSGTSLVLCVLCLVMPVPKAFAVKLHKAGRS